MKVSDLQGREVVSLDKADKVGYVDHVLLDLNAEQAVAIEVKLLGLFSGDKILPWADIQSIGEDAVTIQNEEVLRDEKDSPLRDYPSAASIEGSKVMTQDGQDVGSVGDVDIDPGTGKVVAYLLKEGLLASLAHNKREIPVADVISISPNMIVVQNQAVRTVS